MDKFALILLNIIFFTPVLLFLIFKKGAIKYHKKLILWAAGFGVIFYFIGEMFFMYWKTYWYDFNKTLGIKIGDSVVEILIWTILVSVVVSIVVSVQAEKEEKNQPLI